MGMRCDTLNIDLQNRSPQVVRQPDTRLLVTRVYDVLNFIPKSPEKLLADVWQEWGTADEAFPECRLTKQFVSGQTGPFRSPCDEPPILTRVYDQIDEEAETQVGEPNITYDEDGNINVEINWIQFSSATAVNETVGTTTAPAPYSAAILKEQIVTNDGTLRTIKRIYNGDRTISDVQNLRFGGKVIVRTITAIGAVPPTPSGFTLVGPGVLHPDGREIYTYEFAAAAGSGGTPGTGGAISQGFTDSQNGTVAFNPASPNSATGAVVCTTRYVSTLAVTSNPVTQPSGFVLFAVDYTDDSGFRMWETKSGFGNGLVLDESTASETGALVIYHRIALGSAPTAPSATIGGTVTLFDSSDRNAEGHIVFDIRWAEGNGQSDYVAEGESDGAITYTVIEFDAAAMIPAYPGTGTGYNTRLQQKRGPGYYTNIAVWKKPPADVTLKKKINFTKPGSAVIGGSPIQLTFTSPVTMDILADVVVTYDTTQISDTPFTVEAYAEYYETYTPTDTGIAVSSTKALGGYLAGASGSSGTNSNFNGILCDSWSYQLGSSTPSSFGTGAKVLDVDNDLYLTDISGTRVYRRTKVSYTF